jgi:hypothetical protein
MMTPSYFLSKFDLLALGTAKATLRMNDAGTDVQWGLIYDGVASGALTIAKTGTTARTVTFPDAALTVAGQDYANTFSAKQTIDLGSGAHAIATFGTNAFLTAADTGTVGIGGVCYNNANGLIIQSINCGGTRASPSATQAAQSFFYLAGYGHTGAGRSSAKIVYQQATSEIWSATANGTVHYWAGTTDGTTTFANWMYLQNGLLSIGGTSTVGNGLLQLASGTTKANGIAFGTDVFLYRSAADTLACDDTISALAGIDVADAQYVYLRGDASTNGSVRFSSPSTGIMTIESRISGTWTEIGRFG